MKVRLFIKYSGWNENNTKTGKKFIILYMEGEFTMEDIEREITKNGGLSPFRCKKEIIVHSMKAQKL